MRHIDPAWTFMVFMFFLSQMEKLIHQMQDEKSGVPIRTVKSFMSKIPSVFTGEEKVAKFTVPTYMYIKTFASTRL